MIKFETLNSFPPNANPYHHDLANMGVSIGSNIEVMMPNHDTKECKYLIVVNKTTGERVRVSFVDDGSDGPERLCEMVMNL